MMKVSDIEELTGESIEDMGLTENVEELICMRCGNLIDETAISNELCYDCRRELLTTPLT